MKNSQLKNIIKEEIRSILSEEYVDKFKVKGILTTDTTTINR